jgi:hypothetical protein
MGKKKLVCEQIIQSDIKYKVKEQTLIITLTVFIGGSWKGRGDRSPSPLFQAQRPHLQKQDRFQEDDGITRYEAQGGDTHNAPIHDFVAPQYLSIPFQS